MRVGVISPIAWRTPPRAYGPWEQVGSNVAEGLVARGHEVTLFATADSLTDGHLEAVAPAGYEEDARVTPKVYEALHIARAMEQADRFDLLHNHFDFLPLAWSRLAAPPGPPNQLAQAVLRSAASCGPPVACPVGPAIGSAGLTE